MPMLDMPLEELKQYTGTNPCPEDHAEYWAKALEELAKVKAGVELVQADVEFPGVRCFDMYYTGVRGARIHAQFCLPETNKKPCPAVMQFHGYSGNAGDWFIKLPYVLAGFAVASMDCRGQGGCSEDTGGVTGNTLEGHIIRGVKDGPENLLFHHIFLDAVQLARIVMDMEEIDETNVMATGGSQGGGLAVACAALEPRIAKLAVLYPFLSDYKRAWQMDLTQFAYKEILQYFRRFDPLHEREQEFFKTLGYIDVQHLASRVKAEVLFGATLVDQTCPPSTQFAVYNKLQTKKQLLVYPDYGHELPPGYQDLTLRFFLGAKV